MKRLMAIDYGDARTGIAISDLLCTLVGSTTVIHSRIPAQTAQEICRLAQENEVGEFIVGLPRNMDGSEGPRAQKSHKLADTLRAIVPIPVELWDERQTTVSAANILSENGTYGKKRKDVLDAVAATVILESYMAYRRNTGKS